VRREAGLERLDAADLLHREVRQDDHRRHLDDELDEVGPEDRPHAGGRGIGDRDHEAEADGDGVDEDIEDLHHRQRDPAEDDEVDREAR
jgi:hypothetical protein